MLKLSLQMAEQFFKVLQMCAASLDDDKAMEVAYIYNPWEIGKHYIYTIKFTTSEILIEPHMEDWVDVDAGTQIF